jgi:universal stress protein A
MGYTASFVTRHEIPKHVLRILCPVDFSAASSAALAHALRMAAAHEAELEVLHVWDVPSYTGGAMYAGEGVNVAEHVRAQAEGRLQELIASLGPEAQAGTHGRLASGDAATVILEAAKNADLVVLGAHSSNSISQVLFGSVADRVVSDAPCPVIAIRADGQPDDVHVG